MRIPCFFKIGPFEAAYVVAVLRSMVLGINETVEFLVDTGASRTTICDKDAVRLGIDFAKLEKLREGMIGIGGAVNAYVLNDVELVFRREDEKDYVENFEKIYVLKHIPVDERIMRIPSILGRDMLNRYALVYDKRHEKAYITDESVVGGLFNFWYILKFNQHSADTFRLFIFGVKLCSPKNYSV